MFLALGCLVIGDSRRRPPASWVGLGLNRRVSSRTVPLRRHRFVGCREGVPSYYQGVMGGRWALPTATGVDLPGRFRQ